MPFLSATTLLWELIYLFLSQQLTIDKKLLEFGSMFIKEVIQLEICLKMKERPHQNVTAMICFCQDLNR